MKSAKRSFNIAMGLFAFTGLAHLAGHLTGGAPENPAEAEMWRQMKEVWFNTPGGLLRSQFMFYRAFSISFTVFIFFIITLNYNIAKFDMTGIQRKRWLLINVIGWGLIMALVLRYTFLPPMIVMAVGYLCLLYAWRRWNI